MNGLRKHITARPKDLWESVERSVDTVHLTPVQHERLEEVRIRLWEHEELFLQMEDLLEALDELPLKGGHHLNLARENLRRALEDRNPVDVPWEKERER